MLLPLTKAQLRSRSRLVDGLVRAPLLTRIPPNSGRRAARLHLTQVRRTAGGAAAHREAQHFALLERARDPATLAAANHAFERVAAGTTAFEALRCRQQPQQDVTG